MPALETLPPETNVVVNIRAIALIINCGILVFADIAKKVCFLLYIPPTNKAEPSTISKLDNTLPSKVSCTIRNSSLNNATTATINSVALPNVTFNKPPIVSFVCKASCSVIYPSLSAKGAIARRANTKVSPAGPLAPCEANATGIARNKRLNGPYITISLKLAMKLYFLGTIFVSTNSV